MFVIVLTQKLFTSVTTTIFMDQDTGKPFESYVDAHYKAAVHFTDSEEWQIVKIETL